MEKQIGQTKDLGFQFGLQKTFPYEFEKIWNFIFSNSGLIIWPGELKEELEVNKIYKTNDGIEGLVGVFKLRPHILNVTIDFFQHF